MISRDYIRVHDSGVKIIGQNGNSDIHYTKEKIKELWYSIKIIKR